jgi:hypothetical protein
MDQTQIAEVQRCLTMDSRFPLDCSFSAKEVIYLWGPSSRLKALRIESNKLYNDCVHYLEEHGKEFDSVNSAMKQAICKKWPFHENLPTSLADGEP